MAVTAWLLVSFWSVTGLAVGSFLNLVADRLPRGGSLLAPASHCEACSHRLSPAELVPVGSYVAQGGRCRACGAAIGIRSPVVEFGTGLVFALAAWRIAPSNLAEWVVLLLTSAYLSVLVVITVTDLEHGLILNRMVVPALGLAMFGALLAGWPELLYRLAGGLLGAGVLALIIVLVPGGMGWGDARLAAFVGLVTGLPGTLFALFVGFVSGGVIAGLLMATGVRQRGETIPLGPFLALGGGTALLYGREMLTVFHALSALF